VRVIPGPRLSPRTASESRPSDLRVPPLPEGGWSSRPGSPGNRSVAAWTRAPAPVGEAGRRRRGGRPGPDGPPGVPEPTLRLGRERLDRESDGDDPAGTAPGSARAPAKPGSVGPTEDLERRRDVMPSES
jgi:hypothetical protein